MRQARGRCGLAAVVDGVVDLVTHELNATLGGECVQGFHIGIGDSRARRIVWAVHENEFGVRVGKTLDFVHVDAELILAAHAIEARFNAERLGQRGERGESRQRQNDVGSGLVHKPHHGNQRFRGAGHDLHRVHRNVLHFGNGLAKSIRTRGTAVDQLVIQKKMARFLVREGKDVVHGPRGAGAGGKIEFDAVFVLVEPGVEQERLESHESPRRQVFSGIDSAMACGDDF